MSKLNVVCSKCNEGKYSSSIGHFDDDYFLISCDKCDYSYEVHYTGLDCLMEQSEYNDQMNDDIVVLNNNGHWYGHKYNVSEIELESELKGYKQIHMIDDGYEEHFFYQNGTSFMQMVYNSVHKSKTLFKYVAKEDCVLNLINHFFKK